MQRFRWIALQGSSRGFLPPLLLFYFITTSGIPAFAADVSAACSSPVARVVSIQGSVELLGAGQADWSKVTRLDTPLCEGDRLRTGVLSRAALFIQPETLVRVDQNTSISVSQTAEETLVEFTQEEVLPAAAGAYSCGGGYFITRFPRKFRVNTPHLNAAVEGTEFLVAMRCESTELSVFEGKVLAAGAGANIFPPQSISSGQVLTIGRSEPPAIKLLVKPADAVQWVLYYPPLSDATAEAELPPAEQCRSLPKPLDQTCLMQRAEVFLRLGRVDEAQREVDEAVALDSGSGNGNALRAIISIARNDKAGAMEAATAATTASPNSSRAWLALSYAQQASFKLEDSLSSARKAQALEPNSSVTNARVAELLMSLGRIKDAEVAARAAVDANPAESRAHTVLGFVHLAQIKTKAARADFEAAIERDSSDPMPRLGLGLAIIRDGKLADGREQLEIAVALDPTNSLLRSYVGKAYYEENTKERDQLAATQFDLAKGLDQNDPTPWFYEAIRLQSTGQTVSALRSIEESIGRNENRAVYRSRLLLDQDMASRNADLARIHNDLGFTQLALTQATSSLTYDPGNASAHRFLADSYAVIPRHEIARSSELLQAQLRQPIYSSPIQPQLANDDISILRGSGPTNIGLNELNPLFERPSFKVQAYGLAGDLDTHAEQFIVNGVTDRVSFSASQFHFETDGYRPNNDNNKSLWGAFVQTRLSERTSIQAEYSSLDQKRGSQTFFFDPNLFSDARTTLVTDTARLGGRHEFSPNSDLLVSVIGQKREDLIKFPSFGDELLRVNSDSTKVELQYLYSDPSFRVMTGIGYLGAETREEFFGEVGEDRPYHSNAYVYGFIPLLNKSLQLAIGISYDHLNARDSGDQERANHKLGLTWTPTPRTTIRAASYSALKRTISAEQSLEPTQIAGFNQFFDDFNGTRTNGEAAAILHQLTGSAYVGAEGSRRKLSVPATVTLDDVQFSEWKESMARAFLYATPTNSSAMSAEFIQERYHHQPDLIGAEGFSFLEMFSVPLTVRVFPTDWISLTARYTYVRQRGDFFDLASFSLAPGEENFQIADAFMSFRLPRRVGILTLAGRNIFDSTFRYQSSDTSGPRWALRRTLYAQISLSL